MPILNDLYKFFYLTCVNLRNKKIMSNYHFLLESQSWDVIKIRKWQTESCKNLITHAYENTRFYKKLMDEASFHPDNFNDLNDLKQIPIVSKSEILANVDRIQNFIPGEKHYYSETSGSSGTPLVFYRNADWDGWHNASVFRGYSWHDVSPWERNGYLWGYNFSLKRRVKTILLDLFQNRFRLFEYNENEIQDFVGKLRGAQFVSGYSSMIYEVAKFINSMEHPPRLNLKLVKGTSEKIYPKYQEESIKAFGHNIVSEYGSAEGGIISFECPHGTQHINMETVFIEEVNGQIVITNLFSYSFPIIRYQLGDYVKLASYADCPCGMKHHALLEVLGRVGKVIYGKLQKYPSLTLYYVFKNLASEHNIILNYQAIQEVREKMRILIEQPETSAASFFLKKELVKYYGEDLDIEIKYNVNLKSAQHKRADFISSLNDA